MKYVLIEKQLFDMLIEFHLQNNTKDEFILLNQNIAKALEQKMKKLYYRDLYTNYKISEDANKREKARQEYLDARWIHKDFRW